MDTNKAIQILTEAVEVAQMRGAFKLNEIEQILPAVRFFSVKPEVEVKENKEEK